MVTSIHRSTPAPSSASSLGKTGRLVSSIALLAWLVPAPASAQADLLVIPFVGAKFAGHTNLTDLDQATGEAKTTFGVSTAMLTDGIFGIEADFEHLPHFFEQGVGGLISKSNVTALTGNVVFTVPRGVTRESLRPYLVAGVGLMHAHIQTQANVFNTNSNLVGLDVGGGAIGFISPRAGLRFELRHFKNLSKDDEAVAFGSTRLSFWRLTVGAVFKY